MHNSTESCDMAVLPYTVYYYEKEISFDYYLKPLWVEAL